ncbi:class I SAM-dependent methyltransferase [Acaryochloris marina]|uniref:class I SAM-dependent methyltransferase n=1 Tax=Acaryochloris marina TaxID=155978 RepID=UPI0021C3437F|nr:class I SAM-dependent methyltransferase [Acaryochloris marina]BDM80320.1 hypothetical protein AM10699_31880 [Acaryochloris marina MBIC10699]
MNKNLYQLYDEKFYSNHVQGMSKSAETVLRLLNEHYNPQSVIDIGCGQGAWLAAAEFLGAKILYGMDGPWVKRENLLSENIDFSAINFEDTMPNLDEKYDLCISLEVAEHISNAKAKEFIDFLCTASDIVLFSAAIKCQGGTHHINEQWQSYWIELFKTNGYECLDLFRKKLWDNNSVEWWYRQNIFLFVAPSTNSLNVELLRSQEKPIVDIAHPLNYEKKVISYRNSIADPTLRFCLGCFRRYLKNTALRLGSHVRLT